MLFAAALASTSPDPLTSAIEHFHTVESYRVTIHSVDADGEEFVHYFYRSPGHVRMEFVRPHAGAVLIYNPLTRRVRVWPFGAGHFPELNLSPANPLIRSPHGQHVVHSDVGALLENIRALRVGGEVKILGEESVNGHSILHCVVTGADGVAVADVHRYELWLDMANQFPIKIISRDQHDSIIETVMMEDITINVTLPEPLFKP